MTEVTILATEVKHATYCAAYDDGYGEDCVVTKVNRHMSDGTIVPELLHIKNFKRNFYITKKSKRNHKQKKSCEHIDNLDKFKCRQIDLKNAIAKELGYKNGFSGNMRMLCRSPYVYGTDITTPVLIKEMYRQKYPGAISNNVIGVIDIETDVVHGTKEPIICSITSTDKAYICFTADYAKEFKNPKAAFRAAIDKYVGEYVQKRNIKIELYEGKNAGDICQAAIRKSHEWMLDFVVAWNIAFDVPEMIKALETYGYNPADVFSHPSVEPKFRKAVWKPGEDVKEKYNSSTGKMAKVRIPPQERWPFLHTPSNACWMDGMCVYYQIRKDGGKDDEYNLDYILRKELNITKLKIPEVAHLEGGLHWHVEMQKNYKAEYIAYNLFDDISVELLFEKLGDFASTISVQVGSGEYSRFDSLTKMISNDLQFMYLKKGYVCCSTSDQMATELDDYVYGKDGWIATLASHLCYDDGIKFFQDDHTVSEIRLWVFDVDAVSTYPSEGIAFNIAEETTRMEFNRMEGLTEEEQRTVGINLTGGSSNAAELLSVVYGYPCFEDVLDVFKKDHGL